MLLGIHFVRLFCVLPSFSFALPLSLLNSGGISGTVRVSVSAFNTSREITAFLAAMQALV